MVFYKRIQGSMTIIKNFLNGLSDIPDALRMVMFGLLAASITGVLTCPPDAVHGINHDYHAVWHQRVHKQKIAPAHNVPVCFTGALPYISFGICPKEEGSDVPGADIRFPVLAIIQTSRLLL